MVTLSAFLLAVVTWIAYGLTLPSDDPFYQNSANLVLDSNEVPNVRVIVPPLGILVLTCGCATRSTSQSNSDSPALRDKRFSTKPSGGLSTTGKAVERNSEDHSEGGNPNHKADVSGELHLTGNEGSSVDVNFQSQAN